MTPPPLSRLPWTSALLLAALGAGTVRARRRLRAIPVLPVTPPAAAGVPRAAGWRLLTARGVEPDPATFLAACAYAEGEGLRVLDLLPVDLAAERALGLLRLVDPVRYRQDRLGEGRGAGFAVLVTEEVLARAGVDPGGPRRDPAQLLSLTRRLKEYAADATGLAIAPGLRCGGAAEPGGPARAAELRAQGLPPGALAAAQLGGLALLAGVAVRQGRWGAAAAGLYWLQPYLVLGGPGSPLRPAGLGRASAAPGRCAPSARACVRPRQPAGTPRRTARRRPRGPPRTGRSWRRGPGGSSNRAARPARGAAPAGSPSRSGCPTCSRASRAVSRWSGAGSAGTSSRTPG
ncbi:hypothetical protein [Streptomyces sp. NRRL S-448]|uniref:hypothetical protein n=1 Tax=Streptomyces sp. NRRL S-448 TaxID=1463907 RepID=UPI00356A7F33